MIDMLMIAIGSVFGAFIGIGILLLIAYIFGLFN